MPRKLIEWRTKLPCVSEHARRLSAYLDGELNERARAGVEEHLGACSSCHTEYEQLRFASRSLAHFVVPEARPTVWQVAAPTFGRQSSLPASWLQRFCAMKISVPVPVFAASALTAIIAAGVLLTSRPIQTANAPATITKIIEVPVEREVVRERIITRTLYARPPRSSRRDRARPAANEPPPNVSIAGRATRTRRDEPDDRRQIFARASVEGFRPAADANLRIVKEPEQ